MRFTLLDSSEQGGVTATATAELEYQLSKIKVTNTGTGYAVEKPMQVYVEPPPITARVKNCGSFSTAPRHGYSFFRNARENA